jgi:hypothetical protein
MDHLWITITTAPVCTPTRSEAQRIHKGRGEREGEKPPVPPPSPPPSPIPSPLHYHLYHHHHTTGPGFPTTSPPMHLQCIPGWCSLLRLTRCLSSSCMCGLGVAGAAKCGSFASTPAPYWYNAMIPFQKKEGNLRWRRCSSVVHLIGWLGWSLGLWLLYFMGYVPALALISTCPSPLLITRRIVHQISTILRPGFRYLDLDLWLLRLPRAFT